MKITATDVQNATWYADQRLLMSQKSYSQDVADHLNHVLYVKHNRRWRRYGYMLEALGLTSGLAGIFLLWTPHLELGVLAIVLGFITGVVGHGMVGEV